MKIIFQVFDSELLVEEKDVLLRVMGDAGLDELKVKEDGVFFDLKSKVYVTDIVSGGFNGNVKNNHGAFSKGGRYFLKIDCEGGYSRAGISFWILQYSSEGRLEHRQVPISSSVTRSFFEVNLNAEYFAFAIRLAGSGDLRKVTVKAVELNPAFILGNASIVKGEDLLDYSEILFLLSGLVSEDLLNKYLSEVSSVADSLVEDKCANNVIKSCSIAQLNECLYKYEAAIVLYKSLLNSKEADLEKVAMGLARSYWKSGNYRKAGVIYQRYRRYLDLSFHSKAYRTYVKLKSGYLGDLLQERFSFDSSSSFLSDSFFKAYLALQGYPESSVSSLISALHGRGSLEKDLTFWSLGKGAARGKRNIVLTSGFGWSGSGVIKDWVLGHPNVCLPFGENEMPYFNGRGDVLGVNNLAELSLRGRLSISDVRNFIFSNILDLNGPSLLGGGRMKHFHESDFSLVISVILNAVLLAADRLYDDLFSLLGAFFYYVAEKSAPERCPIMFFNNLMSAGKVRCIEYLPNSVCVVVSRDPRDQYAAQLLEKGEGVPSVEGFCKDLELKREKLNDVEKQFGGRLVRVSFENVVMDQSFREELASNIGVNEVREDWRCSKVDFFKSSKNIGIHERALSERDARYIEGKFPSLVIN